MTRAKLETGLAAKRQVAELERIAGKVLDPTCSPSREVRRLLEAELPRLREAGGVPPDQCSASRARCGPRRAHANGS